MGITLFPASSCESYFSDGKLSNKNTVGGKNANKGASLDSIVYGQNPNPKIMNASKKINAQTKEYYSQVRNASVSPNSNQVPYWVTVSGIDTSHLHSSGNTNLNGAALDEHKAYIESICEPITCPDLHPLELMMLLWYYFIIVYYLMSRFAICESSTLIRFIRFSKKSLLNEG